MILLKVRKTLFIKMCVASLGKRIYLANFFKHHGHFCHQTQLFQLD